MPNEPLTAVPFTYDELKSQRDNAYAEIRSLNEQLDNIVLRSAVYRPEIEFDVQRHSGTSPYAGDCRIVTSQPREYCYAMEEFFVRDRNLFNATLRQVANAWADDLYNEWVEKTNCMFDSQERVSV